MTNVPDIPEVLWESAATTRTDSPRPFAVARNFVAGYFSYALSWRAW